MFIAINSHVEVTLKPPVPTQAWSRFGFVDEAYSNETCVFNRGVVLLDCKRWRELRLTETIEDLVDAYVHSHAKLWRGGISQPPFLLALAGRYMKLNMEWNVRGLGRSIPCSTSCSGPREPGGRGAG